VSHCHRFEDEALLRIELELPLDEHFATCPDCRAAREAYDRLRAGLAALGAEAAPPPDWRARVWQEISSRRSRRRRWRPWLLAGGLAAAAIAALLVRTPQHDAAALAGEVRPGASGRRGAEAHPGDVLVLRATTGGARHAELRVYRNDRDLVLRCPGDPPCLRDRRLIGAELALDLAGRYQPLLLVAEGALPDPGGELDLDAAAAAKAGATVTLGREVVVR
jgi:hypothetical protein